MERIGDLFIYTTDLKGNARAMSMPCADGFTIYIDAALSPAERLEAYRHEVRHIAAGDFEKADVQKIEHQIRCSEKQEVF